MDVQMIQDNGEVETLEALAVLLVVETETGYGLDIHESPESGLTEEWWRSLPASMEETIEVAMLARRIGKEGKN